MIYAKPGVVRRHVLVTGANGFVGGNVVRALLARGDEVRCLVRQTSSTDCLDGLPVELVYGDVTDFASLRNAVRGMDQVYHLAGRTAALAVAEYYRVNTQGMANMARACAAMTSPPVLVVVSSLAAAGPGRNGSPRVESEPAHPISQYGRSKRAGEAALHYFAGVVPITVIRPPIVFGPHDKASLPLFRTIGQFRTAMIPGIQRVQYSLIHADDLARLMCLAAERGQRLSPLDTNGHGRGQGYYFAAGEVDPSYEQFVQWIGQSMGCRRVLAIPTASFLVWVVGGLAELAGRFTGRAPYLTLDKVREMLAGSWICSPEKAVRTLGFSVAAALPQRFQETAGWYRSQGWM